jgi:hypothetical protein
MCFVSKTCYLTMLLPRENCFAQQLKAGHFATVHVLWLFSLLRTLLLPLPQQHVVHVRAELHWSAADAGPNRLKIGFDRQFM